MEKTNRYFKRTIEHIHRVQNNALFLVLNCREELKLTENGCRQLIHNVMKHDRSKFSIDQYRPYVELTEYYHQKRYGNPDYKYPDGMEKLVDDAVNDHYLKENHHPERFKNACGKYSDLESIETVCDLQAMAQEFGEGTCRKYFEEKWKPGKCKNFYDDFNWQEVITVMDAAIKCFEKGM